MHRPKVLGDNNYGIMWFKLLNGGEIGTKASEVCPVCSHPKAYFEIKAENY